MPLDFLIIPLPPFDIQKILYDIWREPELHHIGGVASRNRIGRDVFRDNRTSADNRSITDGDTGHDGCAIAYPDIAAYDYITL